MGDLMWVLGEYGKYVLVDDLTVVDAVDNIMGAHKRAFGVLGDEKEGVRFITLDGTGNFFSGNCELVVRVLQPGDMLEVV